MDLLNGNMSYGYEDIVEWEGLWLGAVAADLINPTDFSKELRSVGFALTVDYST